MSEMGRMSMRVPVPLRIWERRALAAFEHAAECVRDGDPDGALAASSAGNEALRVALGERPVGGLDDWFVDNDVMADATTVEQRP